MQSQEESKILSTPHHSLSAVQKYLFKPFIGSSHRWAFDQAASINRNTAVLDIGCGSSDVGNGLKEMGFLNISAVEVDAEAKEKAKSVYKNVVGSLSELSSQKFGFILLLDVVEHLSNPEEFLRTVTGLLEKDGILLISVPNVAHWSVRIPLLFGFFNYTDRAILDKTHLQFFTRARFKKLLSNEPRLDLIKMGATIEPAEFVLPKVIWNNPLFEIASKLRLAVAHLLPGLMAYQHVAVLKCSD